MKDRVDKILRHQLKEVRRLLRRWETARDEALARIARCEAEIAEKQAEIAAIEVSLKETK